MKRFFILFAFLLGVSLQLFAQSSFPKGTDLSLKTSISNNPLQVCLQGNTVEFSTVITNTTDQPFLI